MRLSIPRFSAFASSSTSSSRPLKLAIIGGGPSGFYAASRLLAQLPIDSSQGKDVEVHVYERLPTPHGLVRYGVAPDHPEVKNVQHKFDLLANDPRFQFFGNVSIGTSPASPPPSTSSSHPPYTYPHSLHIPLSTILPHYTHLLLSHGSSSSASLPNLQNSATSPTPLQNVHPALAFVSWYNGHPAHSHLSPALDKTKHVTIIGQGNVALDCARILLKGADGLKGTDVPESVLEVLRSSKVETVEVVGRRGPGQVAFTTKEFREMMALEGVAFELGGGEELRAEAEKEVARIGGTEERMRKRILGLMAKGSTSKGEKKKTFKLSFLRTPLSYNAPSSSASTPPPPISSITYGLNKLLAPPLPASRAPPHQPDQTPPPTLAMLTDEEVEVATDMVIESVGYRSEGIEGAGEMVPFDERRGRVRNLGGRVVNAEGQPIPNTYTSGWASRGPVGVIASTMYDSYSTIDLLLSDFHTLAGVLEHTPHSSSSSSSSKHVGLSPTPAPGPPPEIEAAKGARKDGSREGRVIGYEEWKRIEEKERVTGEEKGKTAEKFVDVERMLEVLN
ncbi:hypothetical protein BDY24DRAFT_405726 [Mrakia frigida]|uniref:NADPH-adrenodoxin reductase n=1 Tax=Mrakia frigida TaxID=29902 RepID=UPI003FCC16BD